MELKRRQDDTWVEWGVASSPLHSQPRVQIKKSDKPLTASWGSTLFFLEPPAIAAQENLFSRVSVAFFRLAGGGKYFAFEHVQSVKKYKDSWVKELQPRSVFLRIVSGVRYVTYEYTDKNAAALLSTLGMW